MNQDDARDNESTDTLQAEDLVGSLGVAMLCDNLVARGISSSTKIIVDTLGTHERTAIFEHLVAQANGEAVIRDPDVDEPHVLSAWHEPRGPFVIVPYMVTTSALAGRNCGTEAFASRLRDYFAASSGEDIRVLMVFTESGNETQKSARDGGVDRDLVTLEGLVARLLTRHDLGEDEDMRRVARVYLEARRPSTAIRDTHGDWAEALETLDTYLEVVAKLPAERRGEHLNMLGCFMNDASPGFATSDDAESVDLTPVRSGRAKRFGHDRIAVNASSYAYLMGRFEDPLTNELETFSGLFGPDAAARMIEAGPAEIGALDVSSFTRRQRSNTSNAFVLDRLDVRGAHFHYLDTTFDKPLLLIAADQQVTVSIGLAQKHDKNREHPRLFWYDPRRKAPHSTSASRSVKDPDGLSALEFNLDTQSEFRVFEFVLAKGPRSYKSLFDSLTMAVYPTSEPAVAVESDGQLLKQHNAWARTGDFARFRVHTSQTGDNPEEVLLRRAGMHSRGESELESDELDSGYIAELRHTELAEVGSNVVVAWIEEGSRETSEVDADSLEEAVYLGPRRPSDERKTLFDALKKKPHYMDAPSSVSWSAERLWLVSMPGRVQLKVKSNNAHGQEEAVARILEDPERVRLRRTQSANGTAAISDDVPMNAAFAVCFPKLSAARGEVLRALSEHTSRNTPTQSGEQTDLETTYVASLLLTDLTPHAELIHAYLDAWIKAADEACEVQIDYDADTHGALLNMDQLENIGPDGSLRRLTVLPTHPWLLSALLDFQQRVGKDIAQARSIPNLHIQGHELRELYPSRVIEDWFHRTAGVEHLKAEDGAPFHWEFLPKHRHQQEATLDYVTRLVQHKLRRYVRMHPHLRNAQRTLRVGFINPGDARQVFDGIREWFSAERDETIPIDEWLQNYPSIELHLYARHGANMDTLGATFDAFFHEHTESSTDRRALQAMLSKVRYRKRVADQPGQLPLPSNSSEYLHVCFALDLIESTRYEAIDGQISGGWDGCFAQGLLGTSLRKGIVDGTSRRSIRGLWVGPTARARPRALHFLLALIRGSKRNRIDRHLGVNWQVPLPSMEELERLYEYSDWVVHLDRELSIDMFDDRTQTIIEYSDQADPQSPGYDVITVTRHADPYLSQLERVLATVNLKSSTEPKGSTSSAWRDHLFADLNALSGTWALDFLEGNITREASVNRLKGHIGCALVYRWLQRVEQPDLEARYGGRLTPICLSMEELIGATPMGGRSLRNGLASRSRNDGNEHDAYCDDLLVLYLTPAREHRDYRIFGRIIEVKFGQNAFTSKTKGIKQVRNTHELLREYLGGESARLDAVFRQKQLALIIKAQLEQAFSAGIIPPERRDDLNLPLLSSRLATGDYTIEYDLYHEGAHCSGDVFLLTTDPTVTDSTLEAEVSAEDDARVVKLSRETLDWLAFEAWSDSERSGDPASTLPNLGQSADRLEVYFDSLVVDDDPGPPAAPPGIEDGPDVVDAYEEVERGLDMPTTDLPDITRETRSAPQPATLEEACSIGLHEQEPDFVMIRPVLKRLTEALNGHKIEMAAPPDPNMVALGPRLMRVFVEPRAGESISSIRRVSEDIARHVGTLTQDVHIQNAPQHRAIAFDLPVDGFGYEVVFEQITSHASFEAARRELTLPFCAGVEVTGTPKWVDLARMPHMLLAGTTGSGKTVFLRTVLLTMAMQHTPDSLELKLSSSKEMDFRVFTKLPHVTEPMATNAMEALSMARRLVQEMDRRVSVISDAFCDDIDDYNADPDVPDTLTRIVCVIDEYAETVLSFQEKSDRNDFEDLVARLAQKARAAGIHLVVSMQRPDSTIIKGAIKSNIAHRFALRLPQNHDSRVILDEPGAEALLGAGDMLYKDGASVVHRLQVPNLPSGTMKSILKQIVQSSR